MVKNLEKVRKQWLHAELEQKKYKELLVKSDVSKAALEVKLKHARNQLDVEMRKRYKMEADYHYLVSPAAEEPLNVPRVGPTSHGRTSPSASGLICNEVCGLQEALTAPSLSSPPDW